MAKTNAIAILKLSDPNYPKLLREIPNPPDPLYVSGTLEPNEIYFTVVGTRKPTAYGIECAKLFTAQLTQAGFTIVSGLACGIDAIAHQTALSCGCRTIAVLGSGPDIITPVTNEPLGRKIIEHGALVSEFPVGTQPQKFHFPQRDRIMSGLSIGTLVIEAGEKSGALITARNATEQGREVFAIPGPIFSHTSAGTNKLIQEGAKLVTTIDDILCEFQQLHLFEKQNANSSARGGSPPEADGPRAHAVDGKSQMANSIGDTILACLTEPKTIDTIAQETHLSIQELRTALTMLELQRMITKRSDGYYQRKTK